MLCGYSAALPSGWTCAHRLRPLPRTAATTATQIGGREKLELSRGRMAHGGASLSAFVCQSSVLVEYALLRGCPAMQVVSGAVSGTVSRVGVWCGVAAAVSPVRSRIRSMALRNWDDWPCTK